MAKPLKLFISQPMHELSNDEILTVRRNAITYVQSLYESRPIEVIDNLHHENPPADATRVWFLGDSIQKLYDADLIYFAEGYETAKGCLIEASIAIEYGLHAVYVKTAQRPNMGAIIERLAEACSEGDTLVNGN